MTSAGALVRCLTAALLFVSVATASAQERPAVIRVQPQAQPGQVFVVESAEAGETRAKLDGILGNYSPALGQVLKLDPSLLSDADYISPYPALAQFLSQHPEVARDPAYFFENVQLPARGWEPTENDRIREMWAEGSAVALAFVGAMILAGILMWLVKLLVDYRRWLRLSKVQAEVHNKLLDRFAANEELLAYVQSPAGRRFLESSPISLDPPAAAVSVPVRRIIWAIEAGCVVAASGAGLLVVSSWIAEISQPMLALGVLAVSLGAGFVVAAAVSYVMSRRLGLFAGVGKERPGSEPV